MPALKLDKDKVHKINTDYDVLITGGPYRFFMGGSTAPAGTDTAWHLITGPQVIPKGVGAYVSYYQDGVTLVVSGFVPADTAPPAPFTTV